MFLYSYVSLHLGFFVMMLHRFYISIFLCFFVPWFLCFDVSLFLCYYVSMFLCFFAPWFLFFDVFLASVFLCFFVSLFLGLLSLLMLRFFLSFFVSLFEFSEGPHQSLLVLHEGRGTLVEKTGVDPYSGKKSKLGVFWAIFVVPFLRCTSDVTILNSLSMRDMRGW